MRYPKMFHTARIATIVGIPRYGGATERARQQFETLYADEITPTLFVSRIWLPFQPNRNGVLPPIPVGKRREKSASIRNTVKHCYYFGGEVQHHWNRPVLGSEKKDIVDFRHRGIVVIPQPRHVAYLFARKMARVSPRLSTHLSNVSANTRSDIRCINPPSAL